MTTYLVDAAFIMISIAGDTSISSGHLHVCYFVSLFNFLSTFEILWPVVHGTILAQQTGSGLHNDSILRSCRLGLWEVVQAKELKMPS